MPRPTDILRADHALVRLGLRTLGRLGGQVRRGGSFPVADCALLLRFLREYVLAVHARKEHGQLFPAVAMRGEERAARLVGELMRLHEEVTELTHSLVLFWEPVGDLSPEERAGFADTVDAIVTRMHHMQELEEQELFPACDAAVPADDQLDWSDQWQLLERERGARSSWVPRIVQLAAAWGG